MATFIKIGIDTIAFALVASGLVAIGIMWPDRVMAVAGSAWEIVSAGVSSTLKQLGVPA